MEFKAWKATVLLTFLAGFYVIFGEFSKKGVSIWAKTSLLACNLVACHFTMAIMFMYIHFQNDLTYFIGNMQHHSDISRFTDRSNASAVDTLPNGFFACYVTNVTWFIFGVHFMSKRVEILRDWGNSKFCVAVSMVAGFISAIMLKDDHPTFHAVADESMADAIPFSFNYRAYNHVFVHHVNGDSFGSSYIFDPMFSKAFTLLAYVHSHIFGISSPDSAQHFAVAFTFDAAQSLTIMAVLILMFSWSAKMVKVLNTDSGILAKSGAFAWCASSVFFWLFANGFIFKPTFTTD